MAPHHLVPPLIGEKANFPGTPQSFLISSICSSCSSSSGSSTTVGISITLSSWLFAPFSPSHPSSLPLEQEIQTAATCQGAHQPRTDASARGATLPVTVVGIVALLLRRALLVIHALLRGPVPLLLLLVIVALLGSAALLVVGALRAAVVVLVGGRGAAGGVVGAGVLVGLGWVLRWCILCEWEVRKLGGRLDLLWNGGSSRICSTFCLWFQRGGLICRRFGKFWGPGWVSEVV